MLRLPKLGRIQLISVLWHGLGCGMCGVSRNTRGCQGGGAPGRGVGKGQGWCPWGSSHHGVCPCGSRLRCPTWVSSCSAPSCWCWCCPGAAGQSWRSSGWTPAWKSVSFPSGPRLHPARVWRGRRALARVRRVRDSTKGKVGTEGRGGKGLQAVISAKRALRARSLGGEMQWGQAGAVCPEERERCGAGSVGPLTALQTRSCSR